MKTENQQAIVSQAINILSCELSSPHGRVDFATPRAVVDYLRLQIGDKEVETYYMLWLDSRYRLIEAQLIGTGTVDACTVAPRALVAKAISTCARFLILAHNHPSGDCTPSREDKLATAKVEKILYPFDVEVLDHFVVGRAPGFPVWSISEDREVPC